MAKNLFDFTGQVVLITGGRSGIGQATAVAFAEQGAKVVIAGRSHSNETLAKIKEVGGEGSFIKTDVSVSADVKNLVDTIVREYGRLDVAFNNSGLLPITGDLVDQSEEDFQQIIDVDLKGVFLCMKEEIKQMLKQQSGGAIINCGSMVSFVADPGMAPYVAAKHGVAGLTRGAGIEYAKHNIRINMIAPGLTATEMTERWLADPEFCKLVKSQNFVNRWAEPEEIVGSVLFLASPMASFTAGSIFVIDGGQTAH